MTSPDSSDAAVTHGRHCPCSACRREDWTNPNLAHCGMHGPSCPAIYAPIRSSDAAVTEPPPDEDEIMRLLSSDNPRSRQHRQEMMGADGMGYSMWTCVPLRDVVPFRNRLLSALPSTPVRPDLTANPLLPEEHTARPHPMIDAIALGHNLAYPRLGHEARDWRDCPQTLCRRVLRAEQVEPDESAKRSWGLTDEQVERPDRDWAEWIVRTSAVDDTRHPMIYDHACPLCVPNGPLADQSFRCVPHQAVAALSDQASERRTG